MLIIPATWEAKIGGSQFQASSGKKLERPYLKEQAKWGGAHLLSQLHRRWR
jgi:hypothetical protein